MNEAAYHIGRYNVSVLFNEPKLLKFLQLLPLNVLRNVSVLFNEPKLLKSGRTNLRDSARSRSFSALQRAEIAEIALHARAPDAPAWRVSVLFNEPKLLKCRLAG